MDDEQDREYRALCREMRQLPAELAALLKDASPISLHYYVVRELFNPWPITVKSFLQPDWGKFKNANDGRAAQAIGGWEEWERLPDYSGYLRFFGRGNQQDLEKIRTTIGKATKVLKRYLELPVPSIQQWKLNLDARFPSSTEFSPPLPEYYRLLECLCRRHEWDFDSDVDIVVNVDGRQEPLHANWGTNEVELANIDFYALQDFAVSFAEAVAAWLPEGLELGVVEEEDSDTDADVYEPAPPVKTAAPVIESITVKKGMESYCLEADDGRMFSIPPGDCQWIMLILIKPIAHNLPDDFVDWAQLNAQVGGKPIRTRASDNLRTAYFRLNKRLAEWGRPPDGKPWITVERGRGARLNAECKWQVAKGLKRELGRMTNSVSVTKQIDPQIQAKNTADYRE